MLHNFVINVAVSDIQLQQSYSISAPELLTSMGDRLGTNQLLCSGVAWVISARGGLQFCHHENLWDACGKNIKNCDDKQASGIFAAPFWHLHAAPQIKLLAVSSSSFIIPMYHPFNCIVNSMHGLSSSDLLDQINTLIK